MTDVPLVLIYIYIYSLIPRVPRKYITILKNVRETGEHRISRGDTVNLKEERRSQMQVLYETGPEWTGAERESKTVSKNECKRNQEYCKVQVRTEKNLK